MNISLSSIQSNKFPTVNQHIHTLGSEDSYGLTMSTNKDDVKMSKMSAYFKTLKEYASASTTHGIAYVFEDGRLMIERILWIIVVIIAIFIGLSLSISAYVNWQNNPVLTSVGTTAFPIEKVKFPSITICAQGAADEVVDAALFKQFVEYLQDKKNKRKVKRESKNELLPEGLVEDVHSFLEDMYPGAKLPPNDLVRLMASPMGDPDRIIKAKATFNPRPPNNCQDASSKGSSTGSGSVKVKRKVNVQKSTGRKKRFSDDPDAKQCPDDTWWYNDYGTCVHYHEAGKMTMTEAQSYCDSLDSNSTVFQIEDEKIGYISMWERLNPGKD